MDFLPLYAISFLVVSGSHFLLFHNYSFILQLVFRSIKIISKPCRSNNILDSFGASVWSCSSFLLSLYFCNRKYHWKAYDLSFPLIPLTSLSFYRQSPISNNQTSLPSGCRDAGQHNVLNIIKIELFLIFAFVFICFFKKS